MSEVPSNLIPTRITQLPYAPVASEESLLLIVYQGNTYQIMAGDLLQVAGVPTSRQVIAGTGLTGGGQLTDNVTLSIANGGVGTTQLSSTGVTAGQYGSATEIPVFSVDAKGRITAATTIPATVSGYVPVSREVIAGEGLNGGGPLNANVTLNVDLASATPLPGDQAGSAGSSTDVARADHVHPAVDLSDADEVDGILGLSNGGTAKSLVANAGAIIWSGADGLYVGPAGVAGQILQSNGTSQYVWVDQSGLDVGQADNLNGGAANRIAVQTAPDTTGFVSAPTVTDTFLKWNGSSLVWDAVAGAGTVTSVNASGGTTGMTFSGGPITAAGTLTLGGTLDVANGGTGGTTAATARSNLSAAKSGANTDITSVALTTGTVSTSPTADTDIANKIYVDNLYAAGVNYHQAVKYEVPNTTGNLNATYNNGTAGVGATLTNAGTLGAFTPDGVVASVNDRILIYNQTNAYENGVYVVTTVGNGSTPWVLTRSSDTNTYGATSPTALGQGDAFYVTSGNTGAGETYICTTSGPITFGTTAITFAQISAVQVYSAGTGLTLTGTVFSITSPVAVSLGGTGSTSLTSGYLVKGNGTSAVSASVVYDTGTNVGIGTTIPGYRLTVIGGDTTNAFIAGVTRGVRFAFNSTTSRIEGVDGTGAASYQPLDINGSIVTTSISGTEKMRLDASGNLGIGVTPMATGANGNLLQIGNPTTSTGSGLTIGSTTTADIQFSDATTGTGQYAGLIRYSHSTDNMALWTASAERMRIDSVGNVGIGTASPGVLLDVFSAAGPIIKSRSTTVSTTLRGFEIQTGNDVHASFKAEPSSGELRITSGFSAWGGYQTFHTNGSERMRIDSSGQVGIGAAASTGTTLRIGKNLTGAVNSLGVYNNQAIQSDVTTSAQLFSTYPTTAAAAFTLASLTHYSASQNTIGAGSTVTTQVGFFAQSTLTGATNNYGFYGAIASGTGRWNLYMAGTADNYLAGSLLVGKTAASVGTDGVQLLAAGYSGFSAAGTTALFLNRNTNDGTILEFGRNGVAAATMGLTSSALTFGTAGSERMRIDSSGNVGIGTSSPGAKLDVNGNVTFNGKLFSNPTASIAGDVAANLVNTSATGFGLRVAGGASGAGYALSVNNYAGTELMQVTGAGNVGIGTSSPSTKLDVSGTVKATAFTGIDGGTF